MEWTDMAEAVGIGAGVLSAVIGFFYKRSQKQMDDTISEHGKAIAKLKDDVNEAHNKLKDELADFRVYVAQNHVTYTDLTAAVGNLERSIQNLIDAVKDAAKETRDTLQQMNHRIDTKADK
jgi:hypothetical protein